MIGALKQVEAGQAVEGGAKGRRVEAHAYAWKAKYGGMDVTRRKRRNSCGMRTRDCESWSPI
jgi:hypothetical protein